MSSLFGSARPLTARDRARFVLRMGLGEPIGNEDARPGIIAGFDGAFPVGDPRRDIIKERLAAPMAPTAATKPRVRWFKADIGAPLVPPRRPSLASSVYVVGFDRYVKIGITERDVQSRIAGLQTGCPEKLQVYAVLAGDLILERALHSRFAAVRRNGEWFLREGDLADWIEKGCPVDAA